MELEFHPFLSPPESLTTTNLFTVSTVFQNEQKPILSVFCIPVIPEGVY